MNRERMLQVILLAVGLIFVLGVYPLMMYLWPSGWRWQPNQPEYEQMILGIYATLGIFLLIAARNPSQPDRIHCLVEPSSWRDHDSAGDG